MSERAHEFMNPLAVDKCRDYRQPLGEGWAKPFGLQQNAEKMQLLPAFLCRKSERRLRVI